MRNEKEKKQVIINRVIKATEKMMRGKENEIGITLIALVITVIIMLILAGVAISVLTGDGGLFEKTQGAAGKYNNAVVLEDGKILTLINYVDLYLDSYWQANNSIDYEIDKLSNWGTITVTFKINMNDGIKSIVINGVPKQIEQGVTNIVFKYDASSLSKLDIEVITMNDENIKETILIPENDFNIYNAIQLRAFANKVNSDENGMNFEGKTVNIMADIDLGAKENEDGTWNGEIWTPIGNTDNKAFAGTLNGNKHKIKGMYVNAQNINAGLFSNNKGIIKDLGITDSYVYSNNSINNLDGNEGSTMTNYISVGAIVGKNFDGGQILNCYNNSKIKIESGDNTCSAIGGIVGLNISGGLIQNCNNSGNIEGTCTSRYFMQGGVLGVAQGATIKECNNQGEIKQVKVKTLENDNLGGVIGFIYQSGIAEDCYNKGNIIYDTTSKNSFIGGVVGRNHQSNIKNCTNEGLLNGTVNCSSLAKLGGVVGANHNSAIADNLINLGTVNGSIISTASTVYVAGVMGYNYNGSTVTNCRNEGTVDCVTNGAESVRLAGVLGTNSTSSTASKLLNKADIKGSATATNGYISLGGVIGYQYSASNATECINEGNIITNSLTVKRAYIGGILGRNDEACSFYNGYNNGNIDIIGKYSYDIHAGGAVGLNYHKIENVYNAGKINVSTNNAVIPTYCRIGGILGTTTETAEMKKSYNTGEIIVNVNSSKNSLIGGVIALNYGSSLVESCFNMGDIEYIGSGSSFWVGGIAGDNENLATLQYCYNRGNVYGTTNNTDNTGISGLLATNTVNATTLNCYSTGTVSCNKSGAIGGVVGYNYSGTIKNCYYLTGTASRNSAYNAATITNCGAKTQAEMRSASFITTLNSIYFKTDTGNINDGYPLLQNVVREDASF